MAIGLTGAGLKAHSRVQILPSLLAADFSNIASDIRTVESAGADALHLDSMDGQFAPNLSWGPKIVADGRSLYVANCSACHGASAEGNAVGYGMRAPDRRSTSPGTIQAMVRIGPGQMPKFDTRTLTDVQVRDVATYVNLLQTNRPDFGGRALGDIGAAAEGAAAFVFGLGLLVIITRFIGTTI